MVRRIKFCSDCSRRFVSVANEAFCEDCKVLKPPSIPEQSAVDETSRISSVEPPDSKRQKLPQELEVTIIDDSDDECSKGAGSEGEDEIHCTQIQLVDDDPSADDVLESGNASAAEQLDSITTPANSDDICFICGTDLTKLKRRLDHIKRCSKKHGITGKDVKLNNDYEEFVALTTTPTTWSESAALNPYSNARKTDSWDGDASDALRLASTTRTEVDKNEDSSKHTTKQTSLSSFFQAPIRNLNSVLLAGSKKIAKVAELNSKRKAANSEPQNNSQNQTGFRGTFGKSRRNYTRTTCPMYKKISGTDFVVDGFHYAHCAHTKNFFLTHFHSDHYGGISRTWRDGVIYCSEATATLVVQQLGVNKQFIHPLPMLTPTVIESKGKPITVTLLDANHCPGAIMFLFEVGKKKILHVGDFRWDRDVMMAQAPLRQLRKSALDELYLDTTYCNPKYVLPSQDQAIKATISIFEQEMKNETKTLHLFGAYTIGKERMYLSVASKFGMKVYVDSRRYRILSALQWPSEKMKLLTPRKEEASIWVVSLGDINFKKIPSYLPEANKKPFSFPYKRVVGYRPTGWSMGGKPSSSIISTRRSGNIAVHSVPYSEHSSFPELLDCLECLRPKRIVPTVSVSKSDEQVKLMLDSIRNKQSKLPFVK